jgi:hypothetical protein
MYKYSHYALHLIGKINRCSLAHCKALTQLCDAQPTIAVKLEPLQPFPNTVYLHKTCSTPWLHCAVQAHTATYKALKAMPGGQKAQVGLVNHHITFSAAGKGGLHKVAS